MNAISRHWDVAREAIRAEREQLGRATKVAETDFLPAALEILRKPVSPTGRATTWLLLGGLALTIGWLILGRVDVVASAPGKLVPADNVKLVQPAEAGVVRAIHVREGQRVRQGQLLVELDSTLSDADASQAAKALETAELEAARSRAVLTALDGGSFSFEAPPGTATAVAATQAELARAELSGIEAMISGGGADRQAAAAAYAEAEVEAAKLAETLPLLDEQIAANEALLDKGFVSKLRVIEMRRQRLIAARDRDIALKTMQRLSAQMAVAGNGGIQNRAEARARVLQRLAEAQARVQQYREDVVKRRERSRLQRLVAPIDGTVAQLQLFTLGGVIEPTRPVMVIVPEGSSLVAEVMLPNKDRGHVREGQPVALKLDAFPFTRFGTVPGRIETIGSDAIAPQRTNPENGLPASLAYAVRIRLDQDTRDNGDRDMLLRPGMTVTADIRTGRRSLMSYLVSPIEEGVATAGRER